MDHDVAIEVINALKNAPGGTETKAYQLALQVLEKVFSEQSDATE